MRIRLWNSKSSEPRAATPRARGVPGAATSIAGRGLSQRQFLKTLAAAVGAAGAAQLAARPRSADAQTIAEDLTVTGSLTVQGGPSSFAGNLGVGTTSPAGKLDVHGGRIALDWGDYAQSRGIWFRNTTDTSTPTGAGICQANNDEVYFQTGRSNAINFTYSAGPLIGRIDSADGGTFYLPAGGRIRPQNGDSTLALQIATYSGDYDYVTFNSVDRRVELKTPGANALRYALYLQNPNNVIGGGTAAGVLFKADPSNGKGALVYESKDTGGRGDFHFLQETTPDSSTPGLGNAVLTIRNGGNVGVGTTEPKAKLDVRSGNIHVGAQLRMVDANGDGYPDNWIGMCDWVDGDAKWLHIGGITSTRTGDTTAYRRIGLFADRTFVSGNLGIGTVTPEASLHVAWGALKIGSKVIADGNGSYYA